MGIILAQPRATPKGFIGVLAPDADIVTTNWDNESASGSLYDHCDDGSDSTYVVNDELLMAFCGGSESTWNFRLAFENPATNPSGAESIIVYVRARIDGAASGPSVTATMQLDMWNNTSFVQAQIGTHSLTTSWQDFAWVLSQTQKDAMFGNWSGLRLDVELTMCEDVGDYVVVNVSDIYVDFS